MTVIFGASLKHRLPNQISYLRDANGTSEALQIEQLIESALIVRYNPPLYSLWSDPSLSVDSHVNVKTICSRLGSDFVQGNTKRIFGNESGFALQGSQGIRRLFNSN